MMEPQLLAKLTFLTLGDVSLHFKGCILDVHGGLGIELSVVGWRFS